jgi:hypothetical protein
MEVLTALDISSRCWAAYGGVAACAAAESLHDPARAQRSSKRNAAVNRTSEDFTPLQTFCHAEHLAWSLPTCWYQ